MPRPARRRRAQGRLAVAGAAVAGLLLAGCTGTPPTPPPSTSASPTGPSASFVFATPAAPSSLDPALTRDVEATRVSRQVMEGLVTADPSTAEPKPALAQSWTTSADGRAWTFTLRPDVVFHDGTAFTAAAVCANFQRWYTLPVSLRTGRATLTFKNVFGAYADQPDLSVYRGCTAQGTGKVTLTLNDRFPTLLKALSAPAFAIASPASLTSLAADQLTQRRAGRAISAFGQHPVGTGPYRFAAWTGQDVVLTSFDRYWGERGQIRSLTFRTIRDPLQRLAALSAGTVDGFDGVTRDAFAPLAQAGQQIIQRDPYSVAYLGINQEFGPLSDLRVRQAIAYAIDRQTLLRNYFIDGTDAANQFVPPRLAVTSDNVQRYDTDVARAKQLLAASSYRGQAIPFYYPRNATLPWLPAPEKVYAEIARQLTVIGLTIKPVPIAWADGYADDVVTGAGHGLHLLGLTGAYRDPDNFVGPLFGAATPELGYRNAQVETKVARARTLPDGADRTAAYQNIAEQVSSDVPAVPLAFPVSALAVSPRVASYPVSSTYNEVFNAIRLN
ncbi:ABC transporter substrate-binding protein [Tersicoccus solisilvae]|uniref:ABC transporter substrate-binding protein n=1 Tax=Tersicoccus solisilvae TaxID=1882339 RepID=A0ABQ1PJN9_9MICC|nr:ABC transporter substrate-binding protein [Tersicoccus solisilvae]GGC98364.1 ABC transporter substrate-binding protein [Tersicoccus solisilvae]